MLRGRFRRIPNQPSLIPAPFLSGRLVIPRLGIDREVSFLIDTGSDSSLLGPGDCDRLGVDYRLLRNVQTHLGIGGIGRTFTETASIFFQDAQASYRYNIDLGIPAPSPDIAGIPSLLGRDTLNRWRMRYDASQKRLSFDVLSADATIRL
jgi:hypothetical protein